MVLIEKCWLSWVVFGCTKCWYWYRVCREVVIGCVYSAEEREHMCGGVGG